MTTIGERILHLMESRNMAKEELSERSEIGPVSLDRYITDYVTPSKEDVTKIARALGVPEAYITGESLAKSLSEPICKIPILSEFPGRVTSKEELRDFKTIGHITGNYSREDMDLCYFVIAKDNTMFYAKIGAGDKVLINPSVPFESGAIGAVSIDGGKVEIRRIYIDGSEVIIKEESAIPSVVTYNVTEHDIKILGTVVFVISYPV